MFIITKDKSVFYIDNINQIDPEFVCKLSEN